MSVSAVPLACYEFDDSGVDAAGTGPTLTLTAGTYSTTSPLFGTHSLRGTATKTSPVGNLATFQAGPHSIAFWFKHPDGSDVCRAFTQNGALATGLLADKDIDTDIYLTNLDGSVSVATGVLASSTWRWAVMTWDAVNVRFYLDNVLKGTVVGTPVSVNLAAANVTVTQNGGTTRYIKQAAFFSSVLSGGDMPTIYNGGTGLLFADWYAEEEAGTPFSKNIQRFQLLK